MGKFSAEQTAELRRAFPELSDEEFSLKLQQTQKYADDSFEFLKSLHRQSEELHFYSHAFLWAILILTLPDPKSLELLIGYLKLYFEQNNDSFLMVKGGQP